MYPLLSLGPWIQIPTYFLLISFSTIVGSYWFVRKAQAAELSTVTAVDLTLVGLICGFVGARILHILYEAPEVYRENPWQVFYVWNGGFVFFGGALGAFIGTLVFCTIRKEPFWLWSDLAAMPVALGYAIGRLGCFLNGCCYGKVCELPWGLHLHGATRHPTQLYASLLELAILPILAFAKPRLRLHGMLFNLWLLLHACGRLVMESLRDDPRGDLIFDLTLGSTMAIGLAVFAAGNMALTWIKHREA